MTYIQGTWEVRMGACHTCVEGVNPHPITQMQIHSKTKVTVFLEPGHGSARLGYQNLGDNSMVIAPAQCFPGDCSVVWIY